jgi:branched-chain amino acid aminotransferase
VEITSIERMGGGGRRPHDAAYEGGIAFMDGEVCPLTEATVPFLDFGFLQSDAVYEKATVSNGRYFRLDEHFARFTRSCRAFRLENPWTDDEMRGIFDALLALSGYEAAGVFWVVTRGIARPGVDMAADRNNPDAFDSRFYVMVNDYGSITSAEERRNGIDVAISRTHIRIPTEAVDPRAKNFHWMDMKLSLFEARDEGRDWAILTDRDGYLTEAAGANVFVIEDGELATPDSGCLEGITRGAALDLAAELGIPARRERVHADRLRTADEAFLTSGAGGIMAIRAVDGVPLRSTAEGALTTRIHNLYWQRMWEGWGGTPVDYDRADFPVETGVRA